MENKISAFSIENTSFVLIDSFNTRNSNYVHTITNNEENTYKYIIVAGGGGNDDGSCNVALSYSGSINAILVEEKNSSLSSSRAVSNKIAIFDNFVSGDTITIFPHWWGCAIFYGVKANG